MKTCTVCKTTFDSEEAPILVMGAYGNPKFLCAECSAYLDTATLGRDYDRIAEAMDELGKRMSASDPDKQTYDTINELLTSAAERAKAIADGSYDFTLDECQTETDTETFDEVPEELRETEEDKALDEKDAAAREKFDKWFNWVSLGVVIAAVAFVVWKIIERLV